MSEIEVGSEWRCKTSGRRAKVLSVMSGRVAYQCDDDAARPNPWLFTASFLERFEPAPPATPPHYDFAIEPIDAIRAWGLNFALGNVVKYVARAGRKGPAIDDLRKARDYLDHEIDQVEGGPA